MLHRDRDHEQCLQLMVSPTNRRHVRQNSEYQESMVQPDFRHQVIETQNTVQNTSVQAHQYDDVFRALGWAMITEIYLWVYLYVGC